jgi:hypothetical protein
MRYFKPTSLEQTKQFAKTLVEVTGIIAALGLTLVFPPILEGLDDPDTARAHYVTLCLWASVGFLGNCVISTMLLMFTVDSIREEQLISYLRYVRPHSDCMRSRATTTREYTVV